MGKYGSKRIWGKHHLALRPFAAVEQEEVPFSLDGNTTHVATDGRTCGGGTQKGQADHTVRGWAFTRTCPGDSGKLARRYQMRNRI